MLEVRTHFANEQEKLRYVTECETRFEKDTDRAVEEILHTNPLSVITLSGPTCSGKTTMAKKLAKEFHERNRQLYTVSIDDFYYDRDFLIEMAKKNGTELDYDSVKTIDMEVFKTFTSDIFSLKQAKMPIFDFSVGQRTGYRDFILPENATVIFEGIQAIYPEIQAILRPYPHKSICICPAEDLQVNNIRFTAREIRLMRRLLRDYRFRSASPDLTFALWKGVTHNEDLSILPYIHTADIHINSLMGYELFVLKQPVTQILKQVNGNSIYYDKAQEILEKIAPLPEFNEALIPDRSVYREFLGPKNSTET